MLDGNGYSEVGELMFGGSVRRVELDVCRNFRVEKMLTKSCDVTVYCKNG